jgi:zinc transport system substrate-binding protein
MNNPMTFSALSSFRVPISLVVLLVFLLTVPVAGVRAEDKVAVMVSILPQVWFVEQIGGDLVTVEALVGPGHSPATFEPTARQMARLQNTQVYFSAGVPFEQGLLPRISASQSAPPVHGPRPARGSHSHHHGHDHDHSSEMDPHTWLDPLQAQAMADTIGQILGELVPQRADYFLSRTLELKTRLANLQGEIATILEPVRGKTFFVFHPAYGHFAQAFGLHQIAVEADGHEPGPRQLAGVIDEIRDKHAQVLIVQPQFSQKSAGAIARATGVEILVLDPLASRYDDNLRHIAHSLAASLSTEKK